MIHKIAKTKEKRKQVKYIYITMHENNERSYFCAIYSENKIKKIYIFFTFLCVFLSKEVANLWKVVNLSLWEAFEVIPVMGRKAGNYLLQGI